MTGMTNLSKALTDFMGVVENGWTDFGAAFNTLMTGIANTVIGVITAASGTLNSILGGMISAAQSAASTIASILSGIGGSIQGALSGAANAAANAGSDIVNGITGALDTVANAAGDFYDWLVGGSLWPDLMDMLVSQTQAGMSEVKASFEKGLAGIVMGAPDDTRTDSGDEHHGTTSGRSISDTNGAGGKPIVKRHAAHNHQQPN